MNVRPVIVMVRAPAAPLRAPIPMVHRVRPEAPVRQDFASTASVAIRRAPRHVKLARLRKKAAGPMACAAISREEPIPTMNAPLQTAMASEPVGLSFVMAMGRHVHRPTSVRAVIARMASVATSAAMELACNAMEQEVSAPVPSFPMVKPTRIARRLAREPAMVPAGVSITRAAIVPRAANVPVTSAMT